MKLETLAVGAALFIGEVTGHSWLHCSNYHATISGQDFDESECNGYIRQWSSMWGATTFSTDRGINYFGSTGAWCQSTFSTPIADMYDDGYPYAEYYVGDTVRLVWPAKNHANYECFSNIPDTSMKLYYNPSPNQTADLSDLSSWTVLHDFQDGCTAGTDGCGFQNCPKFCDETDDAPCYGDFTVTAADFPKSGFYTFMWYWIFNPGSPYTTCFEAFVHTSGGGGDTSAQTPSPTTASSSGSGSGSSSTVVDSIVQVPVIYSGASYDRDTLVNGANNAFEADDDVSFSVITYSEGTDLFNATVQTKATTASVVTGVAMSDDFCQSIEDEFGVGSCAIDEGAIVVYTTGSSSTSGSSSGDSDDSEAAVVILWSVILTILVLLLVFGLCYYLRQKNYIVCNDNQIIWQGANGGAASHGPPPAPSSGSAGATTTGAGGTSHHKALPSASFNARPNAPPPVPTN